MWVFNLMDYQVAGLSLLVLVFCEVITVSWLYGECLAISLSVLLFICLLTYSFIHSFYLFFIFAYTFVYVVYDMPSNCSLFRKNKLNIYVYSY